MLETQFGGAEGRFQSADWESSTIDTSTSSTKNKIGHPTNDKIEFDELCAGVKYCTHIYRAQFEHYVKSNTGQLPLREKERGKATAGVGEAAASSATTTTEEGIVQRGQQNDKNASLSTNIGTTKKYQPDPAKYGIDAVMRRNNIDEAQIAPYKERMWDAHAVFEDEDFVFYLSNMPTAINPVFLSCHDINAVVNMAGGEKRVVKAFSARPFQNIFGYSGQPGKFDFEEYVPEALERELTNNINKNMLSNTSTIPNVGGNDLKAKGNVFLDYYISNSVGFYHSLGIRRYLEIAARDELDYAIAQDFGAVQQFVLGLLKSSITKGGNSTSVTGAERFESSNYANSNDGSDLIPKKKVNVLFHCVMGVNRSACVLAALLMRLKKWDSEKTVAHLRDSGREILRNEEFEEALAAYKYSDIDDDNLMK